MGSARTILLVVLASLFFSAMVVSAFASMTIEIETRANQYMQGDFGPSFYINLIFDNGTPAENTTIDFEISDPENQIQYEGSVKTNANGTVPYSQQFNNIFSEAPLPVDAETGTWTWTATIGLTPPSELSGTFEVLERLTIEYVLEQLAELNVTLTGLVTTSKGEILAAVYYISTFPLREIITKLGSINAAIMSIEGKMDGYYVDINSTFGELELKLDNLSQFLMEVNATLIAVEGNVALIKTDLGTVTADVSAINAAITSINGSVATIESDIGSIKVDISEIKTTLAEWTGKISMVTTAAGTFDVSYLTNSTHEETTFSDNTLSLTVSGPSGTKGVANVVMPKTLLSGIESTIEQVAVTVNDEQVSFMYTEQAESYTLNIAYTHSTKVIKIFLKGLPPTPFPWHYLGIVVVASVAAISIIIIRRKL